MSERKRADGASPVLDELADRLHSLAIRLLRTVRSEDIAANLSGPRLSALSVIVFAGPLSMGALADAEQVRPPTMTRLVQALEADGLVEREPDPQDGRQVRVRATAKGRRLLDAGRLRRVQALAARMEPLTATARADVARAVEALEGVFGRRELRRRPPSSGRTSGRARG